MKTLFVLALVLASGLVKSQVVINEVCPSNADLIYDPEFFNFSGWVELYNKGTSSINIGNYYLTDDAAVKNKWMIPPGTSIPANGFLLIWCDDRYQGRHTNFNLDSDGEEIVLLNTAQAVIDKITFPEQYTNISYGRTTDGGSTIGYLVDPTPGKKNVDRTGALRLNNPEMSLKSGRYASGQSLTLKADLTETEIYYTIDGSEPTLSSLLYKNAISISKTSTIKAKAYKKGYLPSKTEVKTFFINEHAFTLPVISLSTKPAFLFDGQIGIYADGTNGISGNCQDAPRNWNQDWDRHAVFEYFDKTGSKVFDQNIDIRIGGACSRNNPQKSFALKARDKYGSKTIDNKFFSTKDISEFGGLMMRNSGNDFYYTMFRDALMQNLTVGLMDVDYMAYQPTIVYLNGSYWGIENLREKIDADYIESNFGVDKDDLDLIETYGNALEGTSDRYLTYLDSLSKIDRSTPEAYAFINRYIDVQEFINYVTAEVYYCNTDWPGNNVKFWRQRSTNGKFRWILWDLDFGFALYQNQSYATHPTLDFATDPDNTDWPNPEWSTRHLRWLLEIPDFRSKFLQTLTTSLSTTFKPQRVVDKVNSFQSNISTEIPYHLQRWQLNIDNWNFEVERLRAFAANRNEFMKTYIASFFGMTDNVRINIFSLPANSGAVTFNGITSALVQDAFYYRNLPFEAMAVPEPGYKFSHYKIRKREATNVPLIDKGSAWKYNDMGTLPVGWTSENFDDTGWLEGPAELGYGEGDEATVVSSGPLDNKFITTYFRKTFSVADTVGLSELAGSVLFDDGVVIYLNGVEAFRNNMPAGAIGNNTLASAGQNSETSFFPFTIAKGLIKPGNNTFAVEIHQNSPSSSDVSFNLDLKTIRTGAEVEYTSDEITLKDIANSDVFIEANFVPVVASSGLVINEVSVQNTLKEDNYGEKDDWIEVYNNGTEPVDIANYFVTDKLNNKTKHRIANGKNGETIIAPGAYQLLWADGDVNQGPLHLNFKLSAEGEDVGFYQRVGNIVEKIDEVTFGAQLEQTTFSRIPNITGDFVMTSRATPLAENIFEVPTPVEEEVVENGLVKIYPNPTRSAFNVVYENGAYSYRIVNATGRVLKKKDNVIGDERISLQEEPSGVYLIILKVGQKHITKRIVKM